MNFKTLSIITMLWITAGCTSYLYQGKIIAPDSNNVERQFLLYWTKTKPFLGEAKGGPASLITQCGNRIGFDERPEGIIFRGTAGSDYLTDPSRPIKDGQQCGRIVSLQRFSDDVPDKVEVIISCGPLSDEFSAQQRSYIKADTTPYVFDISVIETWSFLGELPAAPTLGACQN